MHPTLRAFILQYLGVVAATLMPVIAITFLSIPMNPGDHQGEINSANAMVERHMT